MQQTTTTETDEDEQLLSFEDVPIYSKVYYRGREGFVIDKGPHVSDKVDARHLKIQYNSTHDDVVATNIHERVVDRNLRDKEDFWFDFQHAFETSGEQ